MEANSTLISIAMLREVIAGKTYDAVARQHGVSRSAVERRIKTVAVKLSREVGIEGLQEGAAIHVQKLRSFSRAIVAALERYEPDIPREKRVRRILTDDDIRRAVQHTRTRSPCPTRDVALLYVLLTNGARPLEIARLEVRDYLHADGTVREQSVIRADVAINQKARPLFFTSRKAKEAIEAYLAERVRRGFGTREHAEYRGLDPHSRLFLTEAGKPFAIVSYGGDAGMRFLCRGIHETYRKIFRRIGLAGVSALMVRRTVASRLSDRGAAHEQIGQVLGIGRKRGVRKLIPKVGPSLPSMLRELI
jgi:integrase